MSQTLLLPFPLPTTAPDDTSPMLAEVEAAYAALAPQLQAATGEKLSPHARTLAAILEEARKPRR